MGIGVLLPRDFLDRQPKRWQKSQRKRGAIKTLKRMKEKREKLEQKTLDHARRDSKYSSVEAAPAKHDLKPAPAAAAAPAPAPAKALALASSCTPFGDREQGFWAAQLAPNRPLVVRIPDGAQLWLLHAALPDGAAGSPGPVLLRSRVPASQAVVDTTAGKKGREARSGDRLSVRYKGLTTDAQGNWFEFDSNRGKPLHFVLGEGEVIQGWELGIVGMRCGGTRRLIVPPALGYGDRGAGKIRPGATLVFEVTLQNIQ